MFHFLKWQCVVFARSRGRRFWLFWWEGSCSNGQRGQTLTCMGGVRGVSVRYHRRNSTAKASHTNVMMTIMLIALLMSVFSWSEQRLQWKLRRSMKHLLPLRKAVMMDLANQVAGPKWRRTQWFYCVFCHTGIVLRLLLLPSWQFFFAFGWNDFFWLLGLWWTERARWLYPPTVKLGNRLSAKLIVVVLSSNTPHGKSPQRFSRSSDVTDAVLF